MFPSAVGVLPVLLCTVVLSVVVPVVCRVPPSPLRFQKDGTFKIAQFADLHYGEGETQAWGPQADRNSTRVMRNILKTERPDFVVFSGDQITGNSIQKNATAYWAEVVQPCIEFGVPWAIIFGNHDDLSNGTESTRSDLMKFDQGFPLSMSQFGPADIHGISNYYLPVYNSTMGVASVLYFLDSGGGSYPGIVYQDQVDWYRALAKHLQILYGRITPALAFFHIPTANYVGQYSKELCFGFSGDGVAHQNTNNNLFDSFGEMGDVQATFVGHDHGNDWCCPTKEGIEICFGRHTGYGGYGTWRRGSRIVQIQESPYAVHTWVRMEDGEVIDGGILPNHLKK